METVTLVEKYWDIVFTYTTFSLFENNLTYHTYMGNLGDQLSGVIPTMPCACCWAITVFGTK